LAKYITNPGGAVHYVEDEHAAELIESSTEEVVWRESTKKEIEAVRHLYEPKDSESEDED